MRLLREHARHLLHPSPHRRRRASDHLWDIVTVDDCRPLRHRLNREQIAVQRMRNGV